jgi:hypothetical protein
VLQIIKMTLTSAPNQVVRRDLAGENSGNVELPRGNFTAYR